MTKTKTVISDTPDENPPSVHGARTRFETLGELANLFHVSPLSMVRHANAGRIKTIYVGARRLVPPDEVARIKREGLPLPRRAVKRGTSEVENVRSSQEQKQDH